MMKLLAVGTVAGLAGCAHRPGLVADAEQPGPSPSIDLSSLIASGDSVQMARVIERGCRTTSSRSDCYQSQLVPVAAGGRVKLAMGALGQLAALDVDVRRNGHVYAHAIGIAAGKVQGDIERLFGQCSESFQSGCYHGVIQARFAALATVDSTAANSLCAPFRTTGSQRWIRFQCVHGMGHGLTTLYDHDLPKGLAGCDLLSDWWDRHSCYGGAFMENIVNVTHPHHPASALGHGGGKAEHSAEHSEHAEHAGMEGIHHAVPKFKAVDPADQQYPCSILNGRYQGACYQMQTSVMLFNSKGDVGAAARSCDNAPSPMRVICYSSLGRDISSLSMQNHANAINLCSLGTPRYQPWCYLGLVKNMIDLNARPEEGISMCRDVPSAPSKFICYAGVGEQLQLLAGDEAGRRAMCATSEPDFIEACLFGARVRKGPPAGVTDAWAAVKSQ